MKSSVNIKGTKSGMIIVLDKELPFEEIKEAVRDKFSAASGFFGKASVAIAFEGRKLSDFEKYEIADIISECSDLNIVCITEDNPAVEKKFNKSLNDRLNELDNRTGRFYKGNLRNGQVVDFETSIIILGDVNAGAQVVSKGSIIVLGSLNGYAFAGAGGRRNSFIAALSMNPARIRICDTTEFSPDKFKKNNKNYEPRIAFCENGVIHIRPISRNSLSDIQLD